MYMYMYPRVLVSVDGTVTGDVHGLSTYRPLAVGVVIMKYICVRHVGGQAVYVYSTVSGVSLIMPPFCAIIGCANRGNRDKEKRFFRLPSISAHQGDQTQELSKRRREAWLARLK